MTQKQLLKFSDKNPILKYDQTTQHKIHTISSQSIISFVILQTTLQRSQGIYLKSLLDLRTTHTKNKFINRTNKVFFLKPYLAKITQIIENKEKITLPQDAYGRVRNSHHHGCPNHPSIRNFPRTLELKSFRFMLLFLLPRALLRISQMLLYFSQFSTYQPFSQPQLFYLNNLTRFWQFSTFPSTYHYHNLTL